MPEGRYQMTDHWVLNLPLDFDQSYEDGNLVFERAGIKAYIAVWDNTREEDKNELITELRHDISDSAFDIIDDRPEQLSFCYRLDKNKDSSQAPAFFSFNVSDIGHVQMAIYFDDEKDHETAEKIYRSITQI
jgi:hypothetical protein